MIQYTKEYIARLLDRYMDGTSTLQEEDILAQYFKGDNIPEEWACYKEMFQEIEAMKPETEADQPVAAEEPTHRRRRWMIWGVAAAAAVAGIIYLAAPGNNADFQQGRFSAISTAHSSGRHHSRTAIGRALDTIAARDRWHRQSDRAKDRC